MTEIDIEKYLIPFGSGLFFPFGNVQFQEYSIQSQRCEFPEPSAFYYQKKNRFIWWINDTLCCYYFLRSFVYLFACIKGKGIYCFSKNTVLDINKCEIDCYSIYIQHQPSLVPSVRWVFESHYVSIIMAKGKTFE